MYRLHRGKKDRHGARRADGGLLAELGQARQPGTWAATGQTQQTKRHVTRDGKLTVCGFAVPDGAAVRRRHAGLE